MPQNLATHDRLVLSRRKAAEILCQIGEGQENCTCMSFIIILVLTCCLPLKSRKKCAFPVYI